MQRAHAYADDIRNVVGILFIDMIEETVASVKIANLHGRCIGVLAEDACVHDLLYLYSLDCADLQALTLDADAQEKFMALIYRIKGGDISGGSRAAMRGFAEGLIEDGAEAVIAGCTEIPLALSSGDVHAPLVESTSVFARRVVALAQAGAAD